MGFGSKFKKQVRRTTKKVEKQAKRTVKQANKAVFRTNIGTKLDHALGTGKFFDEVGDTFTYGFDDLSEDLVPDIDFNDDVTQFLGASYSDEEEDDDIEYGGNTESTAGTTASTIRAKKNTKTSTGLRVSKGGVNL